ncbi:MAG: acyl-CoA thioesterase [Puniceicoccales bacterium]|nr:acyl-CoA thioesterase [Puniceicoccales bacterium]
MESRLWIGLIFTTSGNNFFIQTMQSLSATVEIKPIFADADPMGVVWHGNYFRYFETAREALFEKIGYGYAQMHESGFIWPVVQSTVKFIAPVYVGQKIRVTAILDEYENRIRINYEIHDAAANARLTRAQTTQIAVNKTTRETLFVTPQILQEKISAFLK